MNITNIERQELIDKILNSRKYREAGLNTDTIRNLVEQEAPNHTSKKALYKSIRQKLHNIVAPYLGEPDYQKHTEQLAEIEDIALDSQEIRTFCLNVLSQHASTKERISHMTQFYSALFRETGKPGTVLDLACGLHPLAFPWMGLPSTTQYHAFDILQPRIDFINVFFDKLDMQPLATNQDILVNPPEIHADLGLFFKEAHRFEKRNPGCNKEFWGSLNVDYLAVSLPAQDLSGSHSLVEYHRNLVHKNLPVHREIIEIKMDNEIIFIIENPAG